MTSNEKRPTTIRWQAGRSDIPLTTSKPANNYRAKNDRNCVATSIDYRLQTCKKLKANVVSELN